MRRASHSIRRQQATNSNPAIRLAEKLGYPLNTFITITFGVGDSVAETASVDFAKIRDRFGKWARRPVRSQPGRSVPPTFYWVLENTRVVAAHWVVHVPEERLTDLVSRLPLWVQEAAEIPYTEETVEMKPVTNGAGLRKYLLKGLDPLYTDLYRIEHVPQGMIRGKRFGYSRNLGPSQCKLHGTRRRHYGSIAPWVALDR